MVDDFSPLDESGTAWVDNVYSKAYVRHLFISQEILAMQIASVHNRRSISSSSRRRYRRHIVEGISRRGRR